MNTSKVILIAILLIAINNIIFLYFGGFYPGSMEQPATSKEDRNTVESGIPNRIPADSENEQTVALTPASGSETALFSDIDSRFVATLKRVSTTTEFMEILDKHKVASRTRYKEAEKRISKMNAFELMEVAKNAERSSEKRLALQYLMQAGKIGKLETQDLKTLYQIDEIHSYSKSQILVSLLEAKDAEAFGWAKQRITEKKIGNYIENEMLSLVYENDPEFIKRYLDDIEIDNLHRSGGIHSLLMEEPELGTSFYSKHFDEMLDSDNKNVFQMGTHGIRFDMSVDQQARVSELFNSSEKYKRTFAISLVPNINSIELLRDSYAKLTKKNEKQSFFYALYGDQSNKEQLNLLRELITDSEDPQMQILLRQLELIKE